MYSRKILNFVSPNKNDVFSWRDLNCLMRPLANILACYEKEYYSYYLLLASFLSIYCYIDKSGNEKHYIDDLYNSYFPKLFGIKSEKRTFSNKYEFVSEVKDSIDRGDPILISVDLMELHYYEMYKVQHRDKNFTIYGYDMDKEIFYILDNLHTKNVDDILLSPFVITFDEMYRMASSFNFFFLNSNMSSYYEFSMESNEVCSLKDVVVVLEKLLSYGEKNYVYPEEYTLHKIKKLQKNELRIAIEQMYIKGNSRNVFYTLFNQMLTNNGVECNRIIEKEGELREKWDNIRDMILRYSYNSVQSEEQLILDEIRNAKKLEMKFRKIAREILSINNWKDNRRVKEYCIINNNNCTIIEKKNAFRVNLTSDYIYDLWNISNDGIQIYPCEKISGLSVFVKTRFDRNEQFHAGVIVNDKEGNRFLFGVFEYTKIILCCPSLADNYEIKSYDIANDDAVGLEVNVLKNDMVSFKVANKAQLFSHEIRIDSGVESIGLFARTWGRVDGVVYFTDIKKIDSL